MAFGVEYAMVKYKALSNPPNPLQIYGSSVGLKINSLALKDIREGVAQACHSIFRHFRLVDNKFSIVKNTYCDNCPLKFPLFHFHCSS